MNKQKRLRKPYGKSITKENISEFYIEDEKGCWIWKYGRYPEGYGSIRHNYSKQRVHRVVYELFKGLIPIGLLVCHSCDNPPCINPKHLFLGTNQVNMKDASDKGRLGVCGAYILRKLRKERKEKRQRIAADLAGQGIEVNFGGSHG